MALPIHFKHALNSVITLLYMKPVANNGTDFICGSLLRASALSVTVDKLSTKLTRSIVIRTVSDECRKAIGFSWKAGTKWSLDAFETG